MKASWVHDDNAALFTDLYQLTMLQSYYREQMSEVAVFDLFVRKLRNRNYFVACGLDDVLHFLESLHFSQEALDYVAAQDQFEQDFVDYLADFRFTGDVYAVPEGTPVFLDEPIIEVVAPIAEAQLVETFVLNQITFQTNLATKARRVVHAAGSSRVVDFGMRRMHGTDAAMKAARASYVAGVHATSNVLAGQAYDLPTTGTMAHSYVEAHDQEINAFRRFAELYPGTTLLVDTYDTLAGVRKVVALSKEQGEAFQVGAIRLDSGDLAELAQASRRLLDEAGLQQVKIFASGSLDEYAIASLKEQDAPIDGFGVGTKLGTIADQPGMDSAYKLCDYGGKGRMKLSAEKSNLPGRKQLYRHFDGGKAVRDVIATWEEKSGGTPLLEHVMQEGERTQSGQSASLGELRAQCERHVTQLPDRLQRLEKTDAPYPVDLSDQLEAKLNRLRRNLEEDML